MSYGSCGGKFMVNGSDADLVILNDGNLKAAEMERIQQHLEQGLQRIPGRPWAATFKAVELVRSNPSELRSAWFICGNRQIFDQQITNNSEVLRVVDNGDSLIPSLAGLDIGAEARCSKMFSERLMRFLTPDVFPEAINYGDVKYYKGGTRDLQGMMRAATFFSSGQGRFNVNTDMAVLVNQGVLTPVEMAELNRASDFLLTAKDILPRGYNIFNPDNMQALTKIWAQTPAEVAAGYKQHSETVSRLIEKSRQFILGRYPNHLGVRARISTDTRELSMILDSGERGLWSILALRRDIPAEVRQALQEKVKLKQSESTHALWDEMADIIRWAAGPEKTIISPAKNELEVLVGRRVQEELSRANIPAAEMEKILPDIILRIYMSVFSERAPVRLEKLREVLDRKVRDYFYIRSTDIDHVMGLVRQAGDQAVEQAGVNTMVYRPGLTDERLGAQIVKEKIRQKGFTVDRRTLAEEFKVVLCFDTSDLGLIVQQQIMSRMTPSLNSKISWRNPQNTYGTLLYLNSCQGEVLEEKVARIAVLSDTYLPGGMSARLVEATGLSFMPQNGAIVVPIFIGDENYAALANMRDAYDRGASGFPMCDKPYFVHMTLGYVTQSLTPQEEDELFDLIATAKEHVWRCWTPSHITLAQAIFNLDRKKDSVGVVKRFSLPSESRPSCTRVVHVSYQDPQHLAGGQGVAVWNLIKTQIQKGYETVWISPVIRDEEEGTFEYFDGRLKLIKVKFCKEEVRTLFAHDAKTQEYREEFAKAFVQLIRDRFPSQDYYIHLHGFIEEPRHAKELRTAGYNVTSTFHMFLSPRIEETHEQQPFVSRLREIEQEAIAANTKIIVNSVAMKEELLRLYPYYLGSVEVIPNGVGDEDLQAAVASPGPLPLITTYGRISSEKGFDIFIEAAKIVTRDRAARGLPEPKFMIFGKTDDSIAARREYKNRLVEAARGFDNIELILTGQGIWGEERIKILDQTWIGVVPSLYEPFGLVLLELMARGVPVIGTATHGSRDILGIPGPGRTACGIVTEKDPQALAREMEFLLENPQKRQEMGQEARRKVEREYRWEKIAQRIEEIYRQDPCCSRSYGITGATGVVGSALVSRILDDDLGHTVYALVRPSLEVRSRWEDVLKKDRRQRIREISSDLLDIPGLQKLVNDSQVIFHTALISRQAFTSQTIGEDNGGLQILAANTLPSAILTCLAKRQGKAFVFTSSYGVFFHISQPAQRVPLREEDVPLSPQLHSEIQGFAQFLRQNVARWIHERTSGDKMLQECVSFILRHGFFKSLSNHQVYAIQKLINEEIIREYPRAVSLRIGNIYGPGDEKDRPVPSLLEQVFKGGRQGIPNMRRSFIYVEDAVEAMLRASALANQGVAEGDRVITVAHPFVIDSVSVAQAINQVWGTKTEYFLEGKPVNQNLELDLSRMASLLNLDAVRMMTVEEGLLRIRTGQRQQLLFKPRIKFIEVHLTNACHLKCWWCSYSDADRQGHLRFTDLDVIAQFDPEEILIVGGGEPTLYRDGNKNFNDAVLRLRSLLPHAKIRLISNGTRIPAGDWLGAVNEISVSLDSSTRQIFLEDKGVDEFDLVWANILNYLTSPAGENFRVTMVYNRANYPRAFILARKLHATLETLGVREKMSPNKQNNFKFMVFPMAEDNCPCDPYRLSRLGNEERAAWDREIEVARLTDTKFYHFLCEHTNLTTQHHRDLLAPPAGRCWNLSNYVLVGADRKFYPCFAASEKFREANLGSIDQSPGELLQRRQEAFRHVAPWCQQGCRPTATFYGLRAKEQYFCDSTNSNQIPAMRPGMARNTVEFLKKWWMKLLVPGLIGGGAIGMKLGWMKLGLLLGFLTPVVLAILIIVIKAVWEEYLRHYKGLSDVGFLLAHPKEDQEKLETFVAWTSKFNGNNSFLKSSFKHIGHNLKWFFMSKGVLAMAVKGYKQNDSDEQNEKRITDLILAILLFLGMGLLLIILFMRPIKLRGVVFKLPVPAIFWMNVLPGKIVLPMVIIPSSASANALMVLQPLYHPALFAPASKHREGWERKFLNRIPIEMESPFILNGTSVLLFLYMFLSPFLVYEWLLIKKFLHFIHIVYINVTKAVITLKERQFELDVEMPASVSRSICGLSLGVVNFIRLWVTVFTYNISCTSNTYAYVTF